MKKPKITLAAPTIEMRTISQLRAHPKNPNVHSASQIEGLAKSYAEFGATSVLVIDENDTILAGHGRVQSAAHAGLTDLQAIVVRGWSEKKKLAFVIADNSHARLSEFDDGLLREALLAVQGGDISYEAMGFDPAALAAALAKGNAGLADPDDAPPAREKPGVRLGDVWLLGKHRLMVADSSDAENCKSLIGSNEISMIVTSPPYNQSLDKFRPSGMHKEGNWVSKVERLAYPDSMPEPEYQKWQSRLLQQWHSLLRDGGSIFYNHKNRYREKRMISPLSWLPGNFAIRQEIVWRRHGSVTQNARMFLPCDERIYWLYKGNDFVFNASTEIKTWSSVWEIADASNLTHAAAFPAEIPRRCILACSKDGETIFDPFCGSGTTIIACEMEGRHCLAIDLDPAYCQVAIERWQAFAGGIATLEGSGQTLEQVTRARRTGRAKGENHESAKPKPAPVRQVRRRHGLRAARLAAPADAGGDAPR
jgi:DNA modification methylase